MSEREARKICKLVVAWLNMKKSKHARPYMLTMKTYRNCWTGSDWGDVVEAHIKKKYVKTDDFFRHGQHFYGDGDTRAEALEELVEDIWGRCEHLRSGSYEELKMKLAVMGELPDDERRHRATSPEHM